jgi:hypothetical protein
VTLSLAGELWPKTVRAELGAFDPSERPTPREDKRAITIIGWLQSRIDQNRRLLLSSRVSISEWSGEIGQGRQENVAGEFSKADDRLVIGCQIVDNSVFSRLCTKMEKATLKTMNLL